MEAKAPSAKRSIAQDFERVYYAEVDPEELAERDPKDLKGAALAHLEFGRKFARGAPKIRAYNPVSAQHGWHSTHTVVEIVNDDMPFLVDSVAMEVNRQGLTLHLVVHPVVRTVRNRGGELLALSAPGESSEGELESFMHVEVDRQTDPARLAQLEAGIAKVLADVRAAVEDWRPMRDRVRDILADLAERPPPVDAAELAEARAFLEWMDDDHFTFLGYREYDLLAERGEHRSVPIADLLIAAAAAAAGLVVLHYDRDYERIAEVTGQPVEWIVPAGTGD